jgi:hypothetical protein|nr:MAG TPA: hypothetical protein [Crassvirales sp.]
MKPTNLSTGYWTCTDEHFCNCYDTVEEAKAHIKFQKEKMNSIANWHIVHIKAEWIKE